MTQGQMPASSMQDMYNQSPSGAMSSLGMGQRQQFPYGASYDRRWVSSKVTLGRFPRRWTLLTHTFLTTCRACSPLGLRTLWGGCLQQMTWSGPWGRPLESWLVPSSGGPPSIRVPSWDSPWPHTPKQHLQPPQWLLWCDPPQTQVLRPHPTPFLPASLPSGKICSWGLCSGSR